MVLRFSWYFANIIPSQVVLWHLRHVITTLNNITKVASQIFGVGVY